jgi:hypothetical protein
MPGLLMKGENMELTRNQREILDHTAHRAAGGYYCGDSGYMQALVQLGLMVSAGKKPGVPDEYFRLTEAGRKALK